MSEKYVCSIKIHALRIESSMGNLFWNHSLGIFAESLYGTQKLLLCNEVLT